MLKYPEKPFARDIDRLMEYFAVDRQGLNEQEAKKRLEIFGKNVIPEAGKRPLWKLVLKQFQHLMVYILLIAAFISFLTDHYIDVYVILAVILVNAAIGFVQEYKAENAVASLKRMLVPKCKVIRSGKQQTIDAEELVPGDILSLEEGDAIPADARLIQMANLRCTEASLTGESVPQNKQLQSLGEDTPMGDRNNMVWKGTFVAGGSAKAIVTGTGLATALGSIATSLKDIKVEKTNFQQKSDKLARQMAVIAIVSAGLLFGIGWFFQQMDITELLLVSIAALVSAIPEGLPAVLSIVLAIGANRMSKRNAIIREFSATESLGAVTTILTDKTGTLTQNTMCIQKVALPLGEEWVVSGDGWSAQGEIENSHGKQLSELDKLLQVATYCQHAEVSEVVDEKGNQGYKITGDPTEAAFVVLAQKAGMSRQIPIKYDLPFSSDHKFRATLLDQAEDNLLILGAPEKLLSLAIHFWDGQSQQPLTEQAKERVLEQISGWSDQAYRVLGLAMTTWAQQEEPDFDDIQGICLTGLVGMMDPPRKEVPLAVANCKSAGVRVIMATGDHAKTALAVARLCGIITEEDSQEAYSQSELELLTDQEFEEVVARVNVFARLTPAMKMKITDVLQNRGELVAMTGDGVNDAPALKKADVGIAMGIMGTDVARDSARVVLADDNFATIVNAIEEGRIVYNNARQTSFFLVTTNFAEIITLIGAIASGFPVPLTATQILWLNLVTDGVCDVALATESGHGNELKQKPIKKKHKILDWSILPFLFINAGIMALLSMIAFLYYQPVNIEKARTMVFLVMAFTQLFNVLNMRSLKQSVFTIGIFTNKYINLALVVSVIIQVLLVEVPFFERIFQFEPVSLLEFVVITVSSSLVLWGGELYKYLKYGNK